LANSGIDEKGNVALELVFAVALSVMFVVPAAVNISMLFQSRIELTESLSVLGRTFQKSPQLDIRKNMQKVSEILERNSEHNLRISIDYSYDQEGLINQVSLFSLVETSVTGISSISEKIKVERASFVP
jgi:hypothetical protein